MSAINSLDYSPADPAVLPREFFTMPANSRKRIVDAEGEFRRLESIERLVQDPRHRVQAFKELHGREPSVVDVVGLLDRPEDTIPRFCQQVRGAMTKVSADIIPLLESANIGVADVADKEADKLQAAHAETCRRFGLMADTASFVASIRESARRMREPVSPHSGYSPKELAAEFFADLK
jgi:hypothetical protein